MSDTPSSGPSSSSSGPPWWLLPVVGCGVIFTGITIFVMTPPDRKGSNQPYQPEAPMPKTIEQGGRRVTHTKRKHHSKNKTRRT